MDTAVIIERLEVVARRVRRARESLHHHQSSEHYELTTAVADVDACIAALRERQARIEAIKEQVGPAKHIELKIKR